MGSSLFAPSPEGTRFRVPAGLGQILQPSEALASGEPGYNSLVLISWDGTRRDTLQGLLRWQTADQTPVACPYRLFEPRMPTLCGEYWTCLPTICRFQFIDSTIADGKSMTRVQHASMLTGQPPSVTTIKSNNGSSVIPPGMTIYELLHDVFGSEMRMAHVGMTKYTVSGILNWARKNGALSDEYISGRGGPDHYTGEATNAKFLPYLDEFAGERFFVFEHQKGIDWSGHHISDSSNQYEEAIMQADSRLAEVLDRLDQLGIADSTLVLVTTDHGFSGRIHLAKFRPEVNQTWMASNVDLLNCYARSTILDVVPTILDALGLDPEIDNSELPGQSQMDWERSTECVPPTCGNGIVEPGEDCDGVDLVGATCESLQFDDGVLGCNPVNCYFDTSECPQKVPYALVKITSAGTDKDTISVRIFDRHNTGPHFDITSDSFSVEISSGGNQLWSGMIEPGVPSWRSRSIATRWQDSDGLRPDGVTSVRMTPPVRRLKTLIQAKQTFIGNLGTFDHVDVTIRAGKDRYDFTAPCRVGDAGATARCEYIAPINPD